MASLRDDMDNILEIKGPETESSRVESAEDTVLGALFTAPTAPPPEPRELANSHRSSHTSLGEDACARMNKRTYLEAAMRVLLLDEEARQMRDRELAAGASSFRVEVVRGAPLRVQILLWTL